MENEEFARAMAEAQAQQGGSAAGGMIVLLIQLAFIALMIASMWKIFSKAGEPGWAAIVPIYNLVVMLKIAGKPVWWIVLFFIPLVNIVFSILVALGMAERFGKGAGFGLGRAFLSPIFYPILGFGSAQYQGSTAR